MSLALARKYRPRNFASVAVQTHVSRTLRGAIARDRVAHGYLLCGPRGTGKTTLARVLAMALNCETRLARGQAEDAGEPCGECQSCTRIWSGGASLDVVEIDAASNRGVDDARELRERAMYAPSTDSRYKVYIVDEAHMLTREAWNALLKILEEPPPRVVFVFATTEPQKIAQSAAPVLSRLQRFDLKRIGAGDIRGRLVEILEAEQVPASADAIALIARAADGSMRDALSLTDQVISLTGDGELSSGAVREALGLVSEDEYVAALDLVLEGSEKAGEIFDYVARLADSGIDYGAFLAGFAEMLRSLLAVSLGGDTLELSEATRAALVERRKRLAPADLLRMLNMISQLEPRFRRSGQQQLLLETLLVRFALLDRSVAIEELLRGAPGGPTTPVARRGAEAAGPAAPAPRRAAGVEAADAGPSDEGPVAPLDLRSAPSAGSEPPPPPPPPPPGPAAADLAAPSSASATARVPLELNHLAERWDDVIQRVRESGRAALAAQFEHALPVSVSASGKVTLKLDERAEGGREIVEEALLAGQEAAVASVAHYFTGVSAIALTAPAADAPPRRAARLTEEAMRAEKLAALRRKDPVLDAAVRELDLELIE